MPICTKQIVVYFLPSFFTSWNLCELVSKTTCVIVSSAWLVNLAFCFKCWICHLDKHARFVELRLSVT